MFLYPKQIRNWILACCSLALIWSCSPSDIDPVLVEGGADFYPVQIGNFWEYRIDTVAYTFAGDTTSGSYFIREVISDSLYLQEGSPVFRVEYYRRNKESFPWQLDSVWTLRRDPDKILKTENNRPIVKLKFPLRDGNRWDGNAFNILQDSNTVHWFKVQNLNKNVSFGGENYASVEIIQKNDSNCINNSDFREVYLKGIGMYSSRKKFLQYVQQAGPDPCAQIPIVEIGYSKISTLLSYGRE